MCQVIICWLPPRVTVWIIFFVCFIFFLLPANIGIKLTLSLCTMHCCVLHCPPLGSLTRTSCHLNGYISTVKTINFPSIIICSSPGILDIKSGILQGSVLGILLFLMQSNHVNSSSKGTEKLLKLSGVRINEVARTVPVLLHFTNTVEALKVNLYRYLYCINIIWHSLSAV